MPRFECHGTRGLGALWLVGVFVLDLRTRQALFRPELLFSVLQSLVCTLLMAMPQANGKSYDLRLDLGDSRENQGNKS